MFHFQILLSVFSLNGTLSISKTIPWAQLCLLWNKIEDVSIPFLQGGLAGHYYPTNPPLNKLRNMFLQSAIFLGLPGYLCAFSYSSFYIYEGHANWSPTFAVARSLLKPVVVVALRMVAYGFAGMWDRRLEMQNLHGAVLLAVRSQSRRTKQFSS